MELKTEAGLRWTRSGAKDARSLHVQSANGHVHASAVIANIVSAEEAEVEEAEVEAEEANIASDLASASTFATTANRVIAMNIAASAPKGGIKRNEFRRA